MTIVSFGFAHGAPPSAGMTFDVRDLSHEIGAPMWQDRLSQIVTATSSLPANQRVAIGCKQGEHRSVKMAEAVKQQLGDAVTVMHRDNQKRRGLRTLQSALGKLNPPRG